MPIALYSPLDQKPNGDYDDENTIAVVDHNEKCSAGNEAKCLCGWIQRCLWKASQKESVEGMLMLPGEEGAVQRGGARSTVYQLQVG